MSQMGNEGTIQSLRRWHIYIQ